MNGLDSVRAAHYLNGLSERMMPGENWPGGQSLNLEMGFELKNLGLSSEYRAPEDLRVECLSIVDFLREIVSNVCS